MLIKKHKSINNPTAAFVSNLLKFLFNFFLKLISLIYTAWFVMKDCCDSYHTNFFLKAGFTLIDTQYKVHNTIVKLIIVSPL